MPPHGGSFQDIQAGFLIGTGKPMKKAKTPRTAGAQRKTATLATTYNYAYPIVEAMNRRDGSLEPWEEWSGYFEIDGEPFQFWDKVDIKDIEFFFLLNWDENSEIIMDALERSAYKLGYEWRNDTQTFELIEAA